MKNRRNNSFLYNNEVEFEILDGGVKRKVLAYGDELMTVEVHFEKGAMGAKHSHPHTQLTYILEGKFEFTIGNERKIVEKGDMVYAVSEIEHGCVCLESGVVLDTFTPCREDFIK